MTKDAPKYDSLHKIPNSEEPANTIQYDTLADNDEISEHREDDVDDIIEEVTEDNDDESSEDND